MSMDKAISELRALCNREIQRANQSGFRAYPGGPVNVYPVPFTRVNDLLKACDKVFAAHQSAPVAASETPSDDHQPALLFDLEIYAAPPTEAAPVSQTNAEIVVPYGSRTGATHLREQGDYLTFCGRNCEEWSVVDGSVAEALESAFTCKRCLNVMLK